MGLEGGLRARASAKRGNRNDAPAEGSNTTADSNAGSDAEDANTEQEAPHPGRGPSGQGGGASRIGMRQPLSSVWEDGVGQEHDRKVNEGKWTEMRVIGVLMEARRRMA